MLAVTWSSGRCHCLWQGDGMRWALRFLLTQTSLEFWDSVRCWWLNSRGDDKVKIKEADSLNTRQDRKNCLNTGVVGTGKIAQIVRPYTGLMLDGPSEVGTTDDISIRCCMKLGFVFAKGFTLPHSCEEGIRKGRYELKNEKKCRLLPEW